MILVILRALLVFITAGASATLLNSPDSCPEIMREYAALSFVIMMGIPLAIIALDIGVKRKRIEEISSIYIGLLIGTLLSYLLLKSFEPFFEQGFFRGEGRLWYNAFLTLSILVIPYLTISFLLQTQNDFRFVIPYVEFSRDLKGGRPIVLDSSTLVDGRIADLAETKLIDAPLIVPSFVIEDLQLFADSSEKVRRARGRRGLDILGRLQQMAGLEVRIQQVYPQAGVTHDQHLVEVAKSSTGRLITNDTNLHKVANVQSVDVINLNDVANSLKPKFLPGEQFPLRMIKEGESYGQGIGYLDDGTMVVCESGRDYIGDEITVEVTSVLQNNAGRMIFTKVAGSSMSASNH